MCLVSFVLRTMWCGLMFCSVILFCSVTILVWLGLLGCPGVGLVFSCPCHARDNIENTQGGPSSLPRAQKSVRAIFSRKSFWRSLAASPRLDLHLRYVRRRIHMRPRPRRRHRPLTKRSRMLWSQAVTEMSKRSYMFSNSSQRP